ncbi:MAG: hypothetical protein OEM60_13585 [Gammaproteobacteria bacterium]|nr:hypothetical protein [Gammaproteobacteria bacterium]MDH3430707.1 hypothetical protein [Gammaproteobacteria bacterium]MDH3434890.1 hypothetical protein [Gammaproteobacteria bacterium]
MLDEAQAWFRRWFAKVWKVRGGGLYACGFAVTFIYLEIRTVVGEIADSSSIGEFLSEQLIEFVFRFAIDSLINTLYALMWPVYFLQWQPPYGLLALGALYIVFANFLKKPITDWLLSDAQHQGDTETASRQGP